MATQHMTVDVLVLVDRNATVADLVLYDNVAFENAINATGSAKREQGDVTNDAIAVNLAVGRALEKLGRELRRQGNAQVKAASDAADAKRARLKEKRERAEARAIAAKAEVVNSESDDRGVNEELADNTRA